MRRLHNPPHFGNSPECYRTCTSECQVSRTVALTPYSSGFELFVREETRVTDRRKNAFCEVAMDSAIVAKRMSLKRFLEVYPVLRFGKRNSLPPFQKGFIISTKSLMGLYEDLKKMNVTYILTFLFYNNPTPFEVQNRIRLLVLTGSASDILLSKRAKKKNDGSAAQCSFDTQDQITEFVSSELCIKITESVSIRQESTNEGKEVVELLRYEVKTDLLESTPDIDHVAGYVAFKCKNIDSSLGSVQEKCDSNVPTDWISIISQGGLTTPSFEWLDKVRQFEIVFAAFHGTELSNFLTLPK
ncbi:hypothetical protein PR048_001284 [Dryococelus australis]|uniref:Uncharacterized protein n=1 Tax=Dryococelus australis TaxID=614101 RepID=A0ABQ9IJB3_9NEOP|nr:hypothetical protein PR048_001284 [Dryococelus australis]